MAPAVEALAVAEGLEAHAESIRLRQALRSERPAGEAESP